MSAHRVVIAMLSPAAFPVTLKTTSVPTFYYGDIIAAADPADLERLLKAGWIEAVEEPQELVAQ